MESNIVGIVTTLVDVGRLADRLQVDSTCGDGWKEGGRRERKGDKRHL